MRVDAATGWSLGLWFVLGLVPTVGESMGWQTLLNHQGLAAWVQAVGSIGAIVAAFNVANAQSRRAELDRWSERAAPVSVRSQLFISIGVQVDLMLKQPPARGDAPDFLERLADWRRVQEQAVSRLRELGSALQAIPLTDAATGKEFATLTFARDEMRQLLEWAEQFAIDNSRRAQVEQGCIWFLQRGNELSRWAQQIRTTGDAL